MTNKITTIIANYNYGKYIEKAINSAFKQTINNKVVVVDDGSSDNSVDIIKSFYKFNSFEIKEDKTYYYSDKLDLIVSDNMGASAARNLAINHSWNSTDFFCILDADDSLFDKKYEKMLAKMALPEVGVVYADYIIVRDNYYKYEYKLPYSLESVYKECIVHSGLMVRKSYLEKVLLPTGEVYDKNLHGPASKQFIGSSEDYDLVLRLSKVCMMVHVPECLSIVNEHGKNASTKVTTEIFQQNMEIIKNNLKQTV